MGEFFSIFSVFALGFVFGWILREEMAKRRVDKLMAELEGDIGEKVESLRKNAIPIKIEIHSGVYYVFNQDTDEFMGQGATRKELEDELAKRHPEKRFIATPENLKEVGFQ
jgi:hypothetical protein